MPQNRYCAFPRLSYSTAAFCTPRAGACDSYRHLGSRSRSSAEETRRRAGAINSVSFALLPLLFVHFTCSSFAFIELAFSLSPPQSSHTMVSSPNNNDPAGSIKTAASVNDSETLQPALETPENTQGKDAAGPVARSNEPDHSNILEGVRSKSPLRRGHKAEQHADCVLLCTEASRHCVHSDALVSTARRFGSGKACCASATDAWLPALATHGADAMALATDRRFWLQRSQKSPVISTTSSSRVGCQPHSSSPKPPSS